LSSGMTEPIKPVVVQRQDAPVKENVFVGEEADLGKLPLIMHYEKDTRPGWFTPIIAMAHPETGRYNLSYHRTLYRDSRSAVVAMRNRHPFEYLQASSEQSRSLPVAMVLGHHPGFYQ